MLKKSHMNFSGFFCFHYTVGYHKLQMHWALKLLPRTRVNKLREKFIRKTHLVILRSFIENPKHFTNIVKVIVSDKHG